VINFNRVKAVIFDLGRVLIKVDFTRGLFRFYVSDNRSSDEQILQKIFKDPLFINFSTGKMTPAAVHETLRTKYGLNLEYHKFVEEWCNIFDANPDMERLARQVARRMPVGLLSDIDQLHWQFCQKKFSFLSIFSSPTLSFEIGALKPDPYCYIQAANNTGYPAENCLFIDDREINVAGAEAVGMQAIHFTSPGQLKRDLKPLMI